MPAFFMGVSSCRRAAVIAARRGWCAVKTGLSTGRAYRNFPKPVPARPPR